MSGQVVASAALASAVTVGAYVVQGILGQDTPWGGIATATVTTGSAFMSQLLARIMSKSGRRVGLQTGYFLAIAGGLIAGLGVQRSSLTIFLLGLFYTEMVKHRICWLDTRRLIWLCPKNALKR